MGVVYKARHRKLNRVVALKMILAGSHASARAARAVRTEAEAVAQLQHPNIVQIYEVGEHEGLPYFSLEFVDGGSLAAEACRQAAAVRRGRPHRRAARPGDAVCPRQRRRSIATSSRPTSCSTSDGVPKITDFGLAKCWRRTTTRAARGPARSWARRSYMPPEQARGEVRTVGPASDRIRWGRCSTSCSPAGRRSWPPRRSTLCCKSSTTSRSPPRTTQPKLPLDLETICLKCLQKEPDKRYASAPALADDLRRFLAGEPILARPVGQLERAWRWCARNPVVASLSAISLLLLLGVTAVSSIAAATLSQKNLEITKANTSLKTAKELAESRKAAADKSAAAALVAKGQAEEAQKLAEQNAEEASTQALGAVTVVQLVLSEVNRKLSDAPGTLEVKKSITEIAKKGLDRIPEGRIDQSQTSVAATYLGYYQIMAQVHREMGESQKALEYLLKARKLAEQRVVVRGRSNASRRNLAAILGDLAQVTQEVNRDLAGSLQLYEEVVSVRQSILDDPIRDPGLTPEFDDVYRLMVELDLAEGHVSVATIHLRTGDIASAQKRFDAALQLRQAAYDALSAEPAFLESFVKLRARDMPGISGALILASLRQSLGKNQLAAGEMAYRLRDYETAVARYDEGLAVARDLQKQFAAMTPLKFEVARTLGNVGDLRLHIGQPAEARKFYDECLGIMTELTAADQTHAGYQRDLALIEYRLGCLDEVEAKSDAAKTHLAKSLEIRRSLAAPIPPTRDGKMS